MSLAVTLSGLEIKPHIPGVVALFGLATYSDGQAFRFRYQAPRRQRAERLDLYTLQHGTGVSSSLRERLALEAARPHLPNPPGPVLVNLAKLADDDLRILIGLARSRAEDLGEMLAQSEARNLTEVDRLENIDRIFRVIDGGDQ